MATSAVYYRELFDVSQTLCIENVIPFLNEKPNFNVTLVLRAIATFSLVPPSFKVQKICCYLKSD